MSGRALALLAAATFVAIVGAGGSTGAGAASTNPEISLGTHDVVPGQKLLITGSGWPVGTALSASLCGAGGISGTTDCAETTTVNVVTSSSGNLWVLMTPVLPPKPCPCVILVTGVTTGYTNRIPVTVAGAATAPVPQPAAPTEPAFQVVDLQVVGGTTLASSLGGAAPRTIEFQVQNVGSLTETPVLLAWWGTGTKDTNVIAMPVMRALSAGQSAAVRARFSLPALSMGRYTVRVRVEVVGFHEAASASASTSTWPIALFVVVLVLLELVALAIARIVRNRRRRKDGVASERASVAAAAGKQPRYENSRIAVEAQVRQLEARTADRPGELTEQHDPTWQLE